MNRRQTRQIWVLLAAATLIPISVLVFLAFRILQQDQDAERSRARDRLEVAAGQLALGIERRLEDIEERLTRGEGLRFTTAGFNAAGDQTFLYLPQAIPANEAASSIFEAAEAVEFQRGNLEAVTSAYRHLAESHDPAIRAGALVRLGGVLRNRGDRNGALEAYRDLEQLRSSTINGEPAPLVARQGRAKVFEKTSSAEDLRREAADLARTLYAGGWTIDRATFIEYVDMLRVWGEAGPPSPSVARTDAAIHLWRMWCAGDLPPRGRRIIVSEGAPVLAVWAPRTIGAVDPPVVWLATPDQFESALLPPDRATLSVSFSDDEGMPLFGVQQASGISLTRDKTHLPFIINVAAGESLVGQVDRRRQYVLIAGLTAAFSLMIAAALGLYRVTTREMRLARQQTDFVSAVSHEFRTPLTSMRHLTDLLASGAITSEERKKIYYELLVHETERLHRMVESLLSFGRIEVGAYAWSLETADVSELVRHVTEEFRRDPQASGREIVCEIEDSLAPIRFDREALTRALWNLLENAAKYSDPSTPIRVFLRSADRTLLLGVEDRGIGIPPEERDRIFQKFVRGTEAKRAGIRGVGIGLALVQRIVQAHGGSVRVESEPNKGSTFTMVLPCRES